MSAIYPTVFEVGTSDFTQVIKRATGFLLATLVWATAVHAPPAAAMDSPDFAAAAGVYRFESGDELTLFGRHAMFERGGEQVHLRAQGPDRYVADAEPFEVITFIRDANGAVKAVSFQHPERREEIATRIEPFLERDVAFQSPGAVLAGSLFLPVTDGPHPAIAIVHGAGRDTRENYRLFAMSLARRGVATLIYDKRGVAKSTGDYSSATFDDLTDDALAAVARLAAEPTVDGERVGLAGFSQGGWIIARAAANDDVAFLVTVSPSGFPPAEAADWLTGNMLAVRGFGERAIATSEKVWQMMYSSLDLVEAGVISPMPSVPGFWFHALDPRLETVGIWEQVRQPVLALWGELDCQVPAHDSLDALRAALERGPNSSRTLRILPGADHGLMIAGACDREIGAMHGGRARYADGYLGAPADWIHALGRAGSDEVVIVPPDRAPSALGWHQSTKGDAPLAGTFLALIIVLPMMLVAFAGLAVAPLGRRVVSGIRKRGVDRHTTDRWWVMTGLLGVFATLIGVAALVEILTLGGVLSAPFLGDGPVAGMTILHAVTAVLTVATLAVGILAAKSAIREDARLTVRSLLGLSAVTLLGMWAGYWGFLPVPGLA